jgi:hypothetical protein
VADEIPEAKTAEEAAPPRSARRKWLSRIGRLVLLVVGIGAIVALVSEAGPDATLHTLTDAAVFLPFVLFFEALWISMDVLALRLLLGERARDVPRAAWLRSAIMAYGVMILLPAGRAGGEVIRASILAPHVGGPRAAAIATRLQGATLFANTLISIPCWIAVAVALDAGQPLAWLLVVNGVATAILGTLIVFASRFSRVGGFLGRRIRALATHGESFDEALRDETSWARPILATTLGRLLQSVQYGVILLSVGGTLTVSSALIAQGIHLVGAGFGDFVPNQVGITEGAYRLFAPALGLEHEPARAIGIALVARICQFFLAGICLAAGTLWRTPASSAPKAVSAG